MPFVHLERDLWGLRDRHGKEITPDVPETARWLLDRGAVGQLWPEVTAVPIDVLAGQPLLHVRPGQPSVDVIYVNWHRIQVFKSHGHQAA